MYQSKDITASYCQSLNTWSCHLLISGVSCSPPAPCSWSPGCPGSPAPSSLTASSYKVSSTQLWFERLSWVHSEQGVGWAGFYKAETRLMEASSIVWYDSACPTYLETICVLSDVAQIWVVIRRPDNSGIADIADLGLPLSECSLVLLTFGLLSNPLIHPGQNKDVQVGEM